MHLISSGYLTTPRSISKCESHASSLIWTIGGYALWWNHFRTDLMALPFMHFQSSDTGTVCYLVRVLSYCPHITATNISRLNCSPPTGARARNVSSSSCLRQLSHNSIRVFNYTTLTLFTSTISSLMWAWRVLWHLLSWLEACFRRHSARGRTGYYCFSTRLYPPRPSMSVYWRNLPSAIFLSKALVSFYSTWTLVQAHRFTDHAITDSTLRII